MKYYDKLIFELSRKGRTGYSLPSSGENCCCCKKKSLPLDSGLLRSEAPKLPEVSEVDVIRHYTNLSQMNFGVDTGFYPLGSCTMKYNPKINEEVAGMQEFASQHPLQPEETTEGSRAAIEELDRALCTITGMKRFTFMPCAGAHGEMTGLMLIKEYHMSRGDLKRTKVIVPDSAH